MSIIKTPITDPNHPTVGHFFDSYDGKIYYCDSYDSSCGFWMKEHGGEKKKNVSERAIDKTFHKIHVEPDGSGWSRFRPRISKEDIPTL